MAKNVQLETACRRYQSVEIKLTERTNICITSAARTGFKLGKRKVTLSTVTNANKAAAACS
jgi:hypothetical protein